MTAEGKTAEEQLEAVRKRIESLRMLSMSTVKIEVKDPPNLDVWQKKWKLDTWVKVEPRSTDQSTKVRENAERKIGEIMNKNLDLVSQKYIAIGVRVEDIKITWEDLTQTEQVFASSMQSGVYAVANAIQSEVGKAWENAFGEANSLLEIFLENMVSQIAGKLATKLGGSLLSGLASLIPGGGAVASFLAGIFHSGGTVPKAHSGAMVHANPNREFPILVRGGETIRTEDQERELRGMMNQGSGTSITLNVGTAIGGRQFVRDTLAELRRQTGLSLDDLTQDRSATLRLADSGR
jgi:hypothetical protein